jgi:hypothetical protein
LANSVTTEKYLNLTIHVRHVKTIGVKMRDSRRNSPYTPRDDRLYKEEEREISSGFRRQELYEEKERIVREVVTKQEKRWQKIKEERLRSLRLLGSELIGNIFERVRFLETRVGDIENAVQARQLINKKSIAEITQDIDKKESEIKTLSDPERIRDLQLDLTNLKMERRRETLLFWKDNLELQRELHQLKEQLTIESKVADLFEELREDGIQN